MTAPRPPTGSHDRSEVFPPNRDGGSHPSPPVFAFEELASGNRTVLIQHNGQEYRLMATKTGKLLLTK